MNLLVFSPSLFVLFALNGVDSSAKSFPNQQSTEWSVIGKLKFRDLLPLKLSEIGRRKVKNVLRQLYIRLFICVKAEYSEL